MARLSDYNTYILWVLLQVELRAFCSKHSDVLESSISSHTGDLSLAVGGDSNVANHLPVAVAMNKSPKLMIDGQNGDNDAAHMGTPDTISDKSGVSEVQQIECSNFGVNAKIMSECGDQQQPINVGELEWSSEDVNLYASLDVALLLKKVLVFSCFGAVNSICIQFRLNCK